ncbi:MAG: hypothetical protein WDW38_001578 [Sanguina aurantia]
MPRRMTRESTSPGRGTLYSGDVCGSSPGARLRCSTGTLPAFYTIGRWPQPSSPKHHFGSTARKTVLNKPVNLID